MNIRVAFAGGYTAGHLTPGFALIEALREVQPHAYVLFMGSQIGPEKSIVEAEKIPYVGLSSLPFSRGNAKYKFKSILHIPRSLFSALYILRQHKITHLFVLGGHASFAPGMAAWLMRVPLYIVEPNSRFGLANKILARFSTRIFVTSLFGEVLGKRDKRRIRETGAPLRKRILNTLHELADGADGVKEVFNVLVLGGSLGHKAINQGLPPVLASLASKGVSVKVVHQAGVKVDRAAIAGAYEENGLNAKVESYISNIAQAYKECDIIVSAAGAITLAELAIVHRPVVVVPLHDAAAAHQKENAAAFADRTGALMILDPGAEARDLVDFLFDLAKDHSKRIILGKRMFGFATPNAATDILREALGLSSLPDRNSDS